MLAATVPDGCGVPTIFHLHPGLKAVIFLAHRLLQTIIFKRREEEITYSED